MIKKHIIGSIQTALIVGIILTAINQLDKIVTLDFSISDVMHWTLNFIVPFTVSLYSRMRSEREFRKRPEIN
ncbi:hypothetical protein QQ008_21010 [Fulvivirgaceae bacterium BMA10]|uniref:Uncharacterized protein n=1 Tax=Splendidivirga corallicola TaxID=3051826 RepID=A0ABT8KT07_9BACT|nr:hypothetical protein [Fulvivirgaceae bacterium BMA10]